MSRQPNTALEPTAIRVVSSAVADDGCFRRGSAFVRYADLHSMRMIGYIFLVVGFLWLALWCAGSVRAVTRSVGIENFKKYPEAKQYSGTEVCDAMRGVLDETSANAHGVMVPAALMLFGGILLDFSGRRNKKRLDDKISA